MALPVTLAWLALAISQDRISHRANVRMDTFQIAQDIKVQ